MDLPELLVFLEKVNRMESQVKYFMLIPSGINSSFLDLAQSIGFSKEQFAFAETATELDDLYKRTNKPEYLISYSTSVIVPKKYIELNDQVSLNIHAASPAYPGRDPHHYAIYDAAKTYGATLHYMTAKVDAGQIIDVELFNIPDRISAIELLMEADKCAWILIKRLLIWIKTKARFPVSDFQWSTTKRTRKDFENFCNISCTISDVELQKRIKAFHVKGFNNLFIELHGKKFYYQEEHE